MNLFSLFVSLATACAATAQPTACAATTQPTAAVNTTNPKILAPAGNIIGSATGDVEYFRGIPYAQPPIGDLRLRPPRPLLRFDDFDATNVGPACPQMNITSTSPLFEKALSEKVVADAISLPSATGNISEDCLTVSVMRPRGTVPDAKLPVFFWIHGGGFEIGSAQPYNASVLIPRAVALNQPFIFVAINYRLGGFGFLGGAEILQEGSANIGLLDQRLALEWVADNIAAFGGDPNAVTIGGESAGAFSVFNQMALYDGNNSYKGSALFRGAIMNSGSIFALDEVDSSRAQDVFDRVVQAAGCSNEAKSDPINCLRRVDYNTYLNATNSVPSFLSYESLALSYAARPDGRTLTNRTDILAKERKFAQVPVVIGTLENEGTVFSLFQENTTDEHALASYLQRIYPKLKREDANHLIHTYHTQNDPETLKETYPEFERMAAILGDAGFILMRRLFLETLETPAWSYNANWTPDTPLLRSFHTSDLPLLFYGNDPASLALQIRYISFIASQNPNTNRQSITHGHDTYWPTWQEARQLINFRTNGTSLVYDDFRGQSFEFIKRNIGSLVV